MHADADQAALLVDAARGFVLRQPALANCIKVETRRIIAKRSQASIDVVPADAASAFGLLGHFFIVDELSVWASTPTARGVWTAIVSAIPKVAGARLVVLTSAGDPGHWSAKVLKQARKSPRWRVHEVPGPLPWVSPDDLEEQRALLPEWEYLRLHLNRWTSPSDRVARAEDIASCVVLDGPLEPRRGVTYAMALDVGLVKDRCVAAIGHAERDGDTRRLVLDRMQVWQGSRRRLVSLSVVEEWIVASHRSYGGRLLYDEYQAAQLVERVRMAGVRAERVNFRPGPFTDYGGCVRRLQNGRGGDKCRRAELKPENPRRRFLEKALGFKRVSHVLMAGDSSWFVTTDEGVVRIQSLRSRRGDRALDQIRRAREAEIVSAFNAIARMHGSRGQHRAREWLPAALQRSMRVLNDPVHLPALCDHDHLGGLVACAQHLEDGLRCWECARSVQSPPLLPRLRPANAMRETLGREGSPREAPPLTCSDAAPISRPG